MAKKPFCFAPRSKKCTPHRLCYILPTEHSSIANNSCSSSKWKRKSRGEDPKPKATPSTCVPSFTCLSGSTFSRQMEKAVRHSIQPNLMRSCVETSANTTPASQPQTGASVSVLPDRLSCCLRNALNKRDKLVRQIPGGHLSVGPG